MILTRRASFTPDTFNADAMTVEAVISTFAPVTRYTKAASQKTRAASALVKLTAERN